MIRLLALAALIIGTPICWLYNKIEYARMTPTERKIYHGKPPYHVPFY